MPALARDAPVIAQPVVEGAEEEALARLIAAYRKWAAAMMPGVPLEQLAPKLEKMGGTAAVRVSKDAARVLPARRCSSQPSQKVLMDLRKEEREKHGPLAL